VSTQHLYSGTLTGSNTFDVAGTPLTISISDVVTENLTFPGNGTFSGTEEDVVPATDSSPGVPPSSSTYDTGPFPVTGNVSQPFNTTIQISGDNSTISWHFNSDQTQIIVSDIINIPLLGPVAFGGTLYSQPPPAVTLLTNAQAMFGNGYYTYELGGDGTSVSIRRNNSGYNGILFGAGIDCSRMVWEALLLLYSLPSCH
jgi:hypothetical protein